MKLTLLVVVAACAHAQVPPTGPPSAASGFGVIEGQVFDASTGQPIGGATVIARKIEQAPAGDQSAGQTPGAGLPPPDQKKPKVPLNGATDDNGTFALVGLEPGEYRLMAVHEGYVLTEFGAAGPFSPGKPVKVGPGDEPACVLRLLPGAVVSGKISDRDGHPMAHVAVQAVRQSYSRGFRELRPVAGGTTTDKGEYRLKGLPPGRYYLSARPAITPAAPATAQAEQAPAEFPTAVFYPGVPDLSAAAPIDASPAADIGDMNFTIGKAVGHFVRGRVSNPVKGQGERLVIVQLARDNRAVPPLLVHLRDGADSFEFKGVLPGSYTVLSEWLEGDDRYTARQPLVVGNTDIDDLKITVAKGAPIIGTLRIRGRDTLPAGELRVQLESMELAPGSTIAAAVKGGHFTIADAPADRYQLSVTGLPATDYVSAVRLGTQELTDLSSFDFPGIQTPIEITLNEDGGEITATVLDDNERPIEDIQVVAVPERRRDVLFYRKAATGAQGEARLSGLAPGTYQLFAWSALEPGAWYDPDFLRPFEAEAVSVRIGPGSRETIKLRPSRTR
jgi:hypothetical protein